MSRNQNERIRNLERPVSGCLGRMVNVFDLNTSGGGNRLLTEKPHYEGCLTFLFGVFFRRFTLEIL
ncbi:hypothetical protein Hanom_Chr00s000001g01595961 [Helianthus anomalus]